MLTLYYFNWSGTSEELREFAGRMKSIMDETEGVEFSGLFIPTSEWHYVFGYEGNRLFEDVAGYENVYREIWVGKNFFVKS